MLEKIKGMMIVISGPSGVGKGTICKRLVEHLNAWLSISVTTRNKREGEIDGKDYYFVSKKEFEEKIKNNEFLEYAKYNENYYGTLKTIIDKKLEDKIDVITEIEVNGAKNIKKIYNDSVLIYIIPPSFKELENRLISRNTDDISTIKNRMEITKNEIKQIDIYDYIIENDDLENAIKKIINIIESEKSKVNRNKIEWR